MRYEDFVLEAGAPAAQLEALRGVTEVVGEVSITDAESLEALSCLERVEGRLSVSGPKTLEGLERLERVGGLALSGRLRNVDALERLTTVDESISLDSLPAVEDLQFSIEKLGGDIFINDVNPDAPFDLAIGGSFDGSIQSVQSAPDLRPFTRRLEHVGGDIDLHGTAMGAVDFSGLITIGGDLILFADQTSQPLPAMGSLTRVGHDLKLVNLLSEDLSSLRSLQRAGGIHIQVFPALRSLHGLEGLRVLEHDGGRVESASPGVGLYGLPLLEDISALAGIERVIGLPDEGPGSAYVSGCDRLSDLHGIESLLPWVDKLSLYELPDLVGFTSLEPVSKLPSLHAEATGLTSLAGLETSGPWFQKLDGMVYVWLIDNPDLVELMPAAATADNEVAESGFVVIEGNTSLGHCEAEAFIEAAQAQGFDGATSNKDSLDDTPCDR